MPLPAPSAEEWRAQVESVIDRYRARLRGETGGLGLDEALAALRKLGLTDGEARRWLPKHVAPLTG